MRRVNLYVLMAFLVHFSVLATHADAHILHPQKPSDVQTDIPSFKPIIATYDIYVGGLHLVTSDVFFQEQDGKYHSHVIAHTYGFWEKTVPWSTMLDAQRQS